MAQVAVAASIDHETLTGSSSLGVGWHITPPTGGQTPVQAVAAVGGKNIQVDFPGDGTAFVETFFVLQTLQYPLAGTHTLSLTHNTPVVGDGDCELINGDDDSQVCIIGMTNDGTTQTQTHNLTSGEIAAIHNYGNLQVRIYGADDTGAVGIFTHMVDHFSFTIPNLDPAGPPTTPFYGTLTDFDPCMDIRNWF